jgi:hypothetical protein
MHEYYRQREYTADSYLGAGCVMIEISGDGTEMKTEFYSVDQKIMDSFTIKKLTNQESESNTDPFIFPTGA